MVTHGENGEGEMEMEMEMQHGWVPRAHLVVDVEILRQRVTSGREGTIVFDGHAGGVGGWKSEVGVGRRTSGDGRREVWSFV